MSITVVSSSKVYASIEDLSENMGISNGDRFILQTDGGTVLFDYENLKIDLEHTTFGTAFSDMQEFQSTVADFVEQITEEYTVTQSDVQLLRSDVDTIQGQLDSIKLMLRLILGSKDGASEEAIQLEKQELPMEGQKYMTEVYDYMKSEIDTDYSLTSNNLMNVTKRLTTSDGQSISDVVETLKENVDAQDSIIGDLNSAASCIREIASKAWVNSTLSPNVFKATGKVFRPYDPIKYSYFNPLENNWFVIFNSNVKGIDKEKDEGAGYMVIQGGYTTEPTSKNPFIKLHIPYSNVNYMAIPTIQMKTRTQGSTLAAWAFDSIWVVEKQNSQFEISMNNLNKASGFVVGHFAYNWFSVGVSSLEECREAVRKAAGDKEGDYSTWKGSTEE